MKVIKPMMLGILWRTYQRNGHRLGVTGIVCFPLDTPDRPLTDPVMWTKIASEFPPDSVWDAGIPKDQGEVLLSARAYSSGETTPASHRRISVRVGPVAKSLDVYGDRVWEKRSGGWTKTQAIPFIEMPIVYSLAFGGEGYPQNPTGTGFVNNPGNGPIPLPNIESVISPIRSPEDRPAPEGLGALDITWLQRFSKVGNYREGEIGKTPPPLPANSDWTLYNQALPDQWIPGFWQGGEPYLLAGLHPQFDRQSGKLPKIRVRSFVTLTGASGQSFVELPMHPETVWLFPHLEIGVVIHRGSMAIETDDASEVISILLAAEDPEDDRPESHYLDFRNRRDTRDPKDLSLYGDAPLLPVRLKDDPQANIGDIRYHLANQPSENEQRTKRILSHKLDQAQSRQDEALNTFKGSPPESLRTEELLKAGKEKIDAIRKKIEDTPTKTPLEMLDEAIDNRPDRKTLKQQMATGIREAVNRIPDEVLQNANITREALLSSQTVQAPLKRKIEETLSSETMKERLRAIGASLSSSTPTGSPPGMGQITKDPMAGINESQNRVESLQKQFAALADKSKSLVRSVHFFPPPPSDPSNAAAGRQKALDHLARSRDFKSWELRGADLSGLDLSGCDFSDSDLIGCDFSGSNLTGSLFVGTWAAHSRFSRAILSRARFDESNIGCSDLTGVRAEDASFKNTILSGAALADCDLSGSLFDGSDLGNTSFLRAKSQRCSFPNAKFMRFESASSVSLSAPTENPGAAPSTSERVVFREVDFSGSRFEKALFMKADFISVNFSDCQLSGVIFLDCSGPSSRFDRSVLSKAVFAQSIDFIGSSFRKADLTGANLRGVNVSGSDFQGSILSDADGSGGDWRNANLQGVQAIQSRFQKADLRFADCRSGDFRQAIFLNADLRFAIFSRGSLYKAGVTGAKIDDSTRWDHALIGKTALESGERA